MTKEERYLIAAYELLKDQDQMDRYKIGEKVNLARRGVNAIVQQMVRSNFLKKRGEIDVAITPTGVSVAKSLLHPGEV